MSKILKRASDDDDNDCDGALNYIIIIHKGNYELASNRRVSIGRKFQKALSALLFGKLEHCPFAHWGSAVQK